MKNFILIITLCLATVFRFLLAPTTFHSDLLSQAGWGEYISQTGSKEFYSHNIWVFSWPNHPPLASLYYGFCYKLYSQISLRLHQSLLLLNKIGISKGCYFDFVISFNKIISPEKPFPLGFLLSLKIFPIVFDILIGLLIYYFAKINHKNSITFLLIYLISPFSFYLSSLWGQTDQITCFLTIVSFFILVDNPIISILLFFLGASIKPTSVFLAPLFLYILIINKISLKKIIIGVSVSLALNILIFKAFTDVNLVKFTTDTLLPRIFDRPPRLTTNSYNFWHIFALDKGWSDQKTFFFIPANFWSGIFYIVINFLAFKIIKVKNIKSIIAGIFIVSFGSWLFLTNMLERYSFVGIITGLLLVIYYPRLFKYWIMLSIIYWLNLLRGWWFPEFLAPLKYIQTTNNYIAGLFLSLGNLLIYLKIVLFLNKENFCPDRVIKNKR